MNRKRLLLPIHDVQLESIREVKIACWEHIYSLAMSYQQPFI